MSPTHVFIGISILISICGLSTSIYNFKKQRESLITVIFRKLKRKYGIGFVVAESMDSDGIHDHMKGPGLI